MSAATEARAATGFRRARASITCSLDSHLLSARHPDGTVTAIYGFSGGGYSARLIWKELSTAERAGIRKVIVIGSPQIKADFPGSSDVLILADPPEGHMAGPKILLESLDP